MTVSNQHVTNIELEQSQDLRGKIVMVTGASSGLGWEFCIDLAKAGCKIIAIARRTDRLKTLCDKINNLDVHDDRANRSQARNSDVIAVAVQLDVSADGPTIETSVRQAWEAFGRIDVLINNAGLPGLRRDFEVLGLEMKEIKKT
ncbi:hypothetical protein L6452_42247 [Arctium lappa]|uniref:Uncharacterized protein n=1 Tax=Arctium lappa TaxID=4217 RepID=A0ACB8XH61_ARCLA|nr:hypothetical protein L6452_42247 [Arctium lappa]